MQSAVCDEYSMKKIIHVDMDCFFAAVEMRDNPTLQNIPIAIGGNGPRSVIATCNYLARQYGVRSAMPTGKALSLCPHLTMVAGRMAVYKDVSIKINEIFSRYTDKIEPLSLDEAFLDVSNSSDFNGSATLIAEQIRADIFNELQLTASAGIAPNKFIAKIASDENKPNGQCVVPPDKVDAFVETLDLKKIPGVGPKTLQKLHSKGFYSCKDVRNSDLEYLQRMFGKIGPTLYKRSFGIDTRDVENSRLRKSLAIETTLEQDIADFSECIEVVEYLLPKFLSRLEQVKNRVINRQGVKLKFVDFSQTTVEQSGQTFEPELYQNLLREALSRAQNRKIRLIGITVGFSNIDEGIKGDSDQSLQLALPLSDQF